MPSLLPLSSGHPVPRTSIRWTHALILTCLAFFALLLFAMTTIAVSDTPDTDDQFLSKRQFQLGRFLSGVTGDRGIPMNSAASDVQNLMPSEKNPFLEPTAGVPQQGYPGTDVGAPEETVAGLSGRLQTSPPDNAAPSSGPADSIEQQWHSNGASHPFSQEAVSILLAPFDASTSANAVEAQQQGNTRGGMIAGHVEETAVPSFASQSLSLGPTTLPQPNIDAAIHATTGGSTTSEASSFAFGLISTLGTSLASVGDMPKATVTAQEASDTYGPTQLGDTSSRIVGPVPPNGANIVPSIAPSIAEPLCKAGEGCLSLNPPTRSRSSINENHGESGIENTIPNSMENSIRSSTGQLCVIKQIVAGVLREVITPCSVTRVRSASPGFDSTPIVVQDAPVLDSAGKISESEVAGSSSGQFQVPGSPSMETTESGNVRIGEVSGQSGSVGLSGENAPVEASVRGPGAWNRWNNAAGALGTPTSFDTPGGRNQPSLTLGCPVIDPMPCPACEACNSCTQIHNEDQADKPGLGPCPERGFRCAECLDGWFCPPKETPAQPVPCGLGWPCLHCTSGWFCELVFTSEPTAMPSKPRPDGWGDESQGSNNMPVPEDESGGQNNQPSSHYGIPVISSPTYDNPPNPDHVQIPNANPLANGEPMVNDGFRPGTVPDPYQGPAVENGPGSEPSEIPISSQNSGTAPSKVPLPLPTPGSTPPSSQLPSTPAVPNPGGGIPPGNGAIGGDGSVVNQSPGPVIMPLPNTENGGVQYNGELIPLGWSNLGCFQDSISRTLLGARPTDFLKGVMSNTLCIQHCSSRGYTVAGTENGQECWCGTAIRDDAVRLPENYCGTPCQDRTGSFCGGSWAVLVYIISQTPHPPEYGSPQGDFETRPRGSEPLMERSVRKGDSTELRGVKHRIGIREVRESKRRGSSFTVDDTLLDVETCEREAPTKD